jgi:hypothetical protein
MPSGLATALGAGHAALQLASDDEGFYRYITWMARGNPLQALFPHQRRQVLPKLVEGRINYGVDAEVMEGWDLMGNPDQPHHAIKLPTLRLHPTPEKLRYGIDVARICDFWEDRLQNEPTYAFLSRKQNCTGCVVEALRAGGLDYYSDKPKNYFVQDARTLLTWVQAAKKKLDRLNQRQADINTLMTALAAQYADEPNTGNGVPSIAEWKQESDKGVNPVFASRKEQVANLDRLIKDYPKATDKLTRFVLLLRMQSEIHSHLTAKPTSARRDAVERLGARVTVALRNLGIGHAHFEDLDPKMADWAVRNLVWSVERNSCYFAPWEDGF